jgi:hypothetical protein
MNFTIQAATGMGHRNRPERNREARKGERILRDRTKERSQSSGIHRERCRNEGRSMGQTVRRDGRGWPNRLVREQESMTRDDNGLKADAAMCEAAVADLMKAAEALLKNLRGGASMVERRALRRTITDLRQEIKL